MPNIHADTSNSHKRKDSTSFLGTVFREPLRAACGGVMAPWLSHAYWFITQLIVVNHMAKDGYIMTVNDGNDSGSE